VRQYSWLFEDIKNKDVKDIIILSGDHLYRMDYMAFVDRHREVNADITGTLIPKPYTLHLKPYTLHPTPYTLNPKPYTLNPTP
jgi:ADP-glucose pyrophosphorylase